MSHLLRRAIRPFVLSLLFLGFFSAVAQIPRLRVREETAREQFKRALNFYNSQQYVAAREFFYRALDIYPYFHLARRYLGDSYYYSGDWNGALDQWEFLDNLSDGAYPLVRQRSELLRFYLNDYRDPGDYIFLRSFNPLTWRGYEMYRPVDTAIDDSGTMFLLSYGSARILAVTPGGQIQYEIRGPFFDRMKGPLSMTLHEGKFYVSDYLDDRVRVFEINGSRVFSFGGTGSEEGKFRGPAGIALTSDAIYVADSGNRRIQKFDREGKFILAFGEDNHQEKPVLPSGIALFEETVYVSDRDGKRILKYDMDGNYTGDIRSELLELPRGLSLYQNRLIVSDEKNGILFYNLLDGKWDKLPDLRDNDDKPVFLNKPYSARADRNGVLLLSEFGAQRVMQVVPRGLATSNMDCRIQRVDARAFPEIGVFLTVNNRLGSPVPGLTNSEIFLYENDNRIGQIRTDNIKPYNNRVNLTILKENSEFFRQQYDSYLPSLMKEILDPIRIADRVRVIRIGEQVRTVFDSLRRREILKNMMEGDAVEEPNLSKGLFESITSLLPEIGPRYVLFVVSGKYYSGSFNQYSLQRIRQYAEANNIVIHVLSFEGEEDPDRKEQVIANLQSLAQRSGGEYHNAFRETEIRGLYDRMKNSPDRRYIVTYRAPADQNISGRYVEIRVEIQHLGTNGIADGGYFVP